MIDMFALLVSCGMTAIVVFFAIRLNHTRPWFDRPRATPRSADVTPSPTSRRTAARRPVRR